MLYLFATNRYSTMSFRQSCVAAATLDRWASRAVRMTRQEPGRAESAILGAGPASKNWSSFPRHDLNQAVIVAGLSFPLGGNAPQCHPVIPGHPLLWGLIHLPGVSVQLAGVTDGVGPGEFRGVEQAHEEIHTRAPY